MSYKANYLPAVKPNVVASKLYAMSGTNILSTDCENGAYLLNSIKDGRS